MICIHRSFICKADVERTVCDDSTAYTAELSVRCVDCGAEMVFIGVEPGFSFDRPVVDEKRTKLSVPVRPQGEASITARTAAPRLGLLN